MNKKGLRILVADDTDSDRLILESIVKKEGHEVLGACNGLEAVELFKRERPDIVLLDALMPELDGFGAARQIKALAGEELVPIIFLTSLSDTESLVQCLDAGGDDFLSKPYNRVILQAKIKSFNRVRELHATMLVQRDQIVQHNENMLQEQEVAKQVFDNIAHSGCLNASNVKHLLSPMAVFNGDVLVAAMRPSGSMFVLLGDFTGHGLPAAIGAMPLASAFYDMAHKGFSMKDILREINQKLKAILPVGLFCCATLIEMDFRTNVAKVWNGGLPDSFIYRHRTGEIEVVKSRHLPLGIVSDKQFEDSRLHIELEEGDRFYLWTDGIHEARNHQGDMFGEERLKQVFADNQKVDNLFNDILLNVQEFVGEEEKDDDLSLAEIIMTAPENLPVKSGDFEHVGSGLTEWSLDFEVKAASFRTFDPLPLLLNVLAEVPDLNRHTSSLYTILSELYSNALDHGVLGLDSAMKANHEGFASYYALRDLRLKELKDGYICFHLQHTASDQGGKLVIRVKDSGSGFDSEAEGNATLQQYSGRGISLVRKLCDSLCHTGKGNEVEAVYTWHELS